MKKFLSVFIVLLSAVTLQAQHILIPTPVSVSQQPGMLTLSNSVGISANDASLQFPAAYLAQRFSKASTLAVQQQVTEAGAQIVLQIDKNASSNPEGYVLSVTDKQAVIKAPTAAGVFYGVQSLLQLLPPQIYGTEKAANVQWTIPATEITDAPRMAYRGLMLDVCRHFFTVDEVKQFIDNMVRYKYNMLHLGLSNDEGFRLEIKSYPKLTSVGAWRANRTGSFGNMRKPLPGEKADYGGFYTQEQMKDIIQYAAERYIQIMPEINVPAHSQAIVASYPELACTPVGPNYTPRVGERIIDWSKGMPLQALIDNNLCPANEKVYTFLDKVIGEVAALFPYPYIHLGGDEAAYNFWEKSPQVKALMAKEKLKDMHAVQGYFTKRVEKLVHKHGKKMVGWDEVLSGNINTSTAIMSWRGDKPGIEASSRGHKVIMAPSTYVYLDLMQADVVNDPRVYDKVRISKSYEFDPVPKGAVEDNIIGGQANLWTEQIYNMRQAEYMLWPRAMSVAESLWSRPEQKNWPDFVRRMENHLPKLDASDTKYSLAIYEPIVTVSGSKADPVISMVSETENLTLHYSFDNSTPDHHYPAYTEKLVMPKDAALLRVQAYRGNKPMGRLMNFTREELEKRVK